MSLTSLPNEVMPNNDRVQRIVVSCPVCGEDVYRTANGVALNIGTMSNYDAGRMSLVLIGDAVIGVGARTARWFYDVHEHQPFEHVATPEMDEPLAIWPDEDPIVQAVRAEVNARAVLEERKAEALDAHERSVRARHNVNEAERAHRDAVSSLAAAVNASDIPISATVQEDSDG